MRTPEEQAEWLIDHCMLEVLTIDKHNYNTDDDNLKFSKTLACLIVDEILKLPCLTDEGWLNVDENYKIQYWEKVKQNIKKYRHNEE